MENTGKVFRPGEVLGGQQIEVKLRNSHPTVKPIDLMSYLVKMFTFKGGTVLDPWNGTGTTTQVACEKGISSVGVDINPVANLIAKSKVNLPSIYQIDQLLSRQNIFSNLIL